MIRTATPNASAVARTDHHAARAGTPAGVHAIEWLSLRGIGTPGLPVCLIAFDAAAFDPRAFADFGIGCPDSVERSVRKRQAEFFHGRLAARHALSTLGAAPIDVPIGTSREPIWPTGVVGSISHNQTFAAAVALERVRHSGIGIDIEQVIAADMQSAMLATAVSVDELAYLQTLVTQMSLNRLLTIVFSAKESLFKGAFAAVARYFDFSVAHVFLVDFERRRVLLSLKETLSDEFTRMQVCEVHFDFFRPDIVITSYAW